MDTGLTFRKNQKKNFSFLAIAFFCQSTAEYYSIPGIENCLKTKR